MGFAPSVEAKNDQMTKNRVRCASSELKKGSQKAYRRVCARGLSSPFDIAFCIKYITIEAIVKTLGEDTASEKTETLFIILACQDNQRYYSPR